MWRIRDANRLIFKENRMFERFTQMGIQGQVFLCAKKPDERREDSGHIRKSLEYNPWFQYVLEHSGAQSERGTG